MSTSDTPRTDAVAWRGWRNGDPAVSADFARQLERELNAAREDKERLTRICQKLEAQIAEGLTKDEAARLRAEVERLTEENKGLRAGKPIGAVVGAMTIMEQDKTISDLRAQLAAAQESGEPMPERPGEPSDFAGAIRRMRLAEEQLAAAQEAILFADEELARFETSGAEMFRQRYRAAIDAARKEAK